MKHIFGMLLQFVLFSQNTTLGVVLNFSFRTTQRITSLVCEELSSLMKVWEKGLLFSISTESCCQTSLCLACDYLEKAITTIRYLDSGTDVVGGGSRRGTKLRLPLLG